MTEKQPSRIRQAILERVAAGDLSADEASSMLNALASQPGSESEPATAASATPPPTAEKAREVKIEIREEDDGADETIIEVEEDPAPADDATPMAESICIRVTDAKGEDRVRVKLSLQLLDLGLRLGSELAPEMADVNWQEWRNRLRKTSAGALFVVDDAKSGEQIQIYLD